MKVRLKILIPVLLLLGGSGYFAWKKFQTPPKATAAPSATGRPAGRDSTPLRIQGLKIQPTVFAETITASGSLRAEESVELQAEIGGKVIAINFTEGMPVKAGAVLVKIDDASLQASLRRALARRDLALLREQRVGRLVGEGGVSKQDFDEAKSGLAVQDAEVDLIRAEIAKTEIRAPFNGIAGLRFISLGAYVSPATRIATLQSVDELKIDFSVPERYATSVKPGARMSFTVAGSDKKHEGEVYAVEPRVDVSTRTVLLRARSHNSDYSLLPGVFARIEFTVSKRDDALLVPTHALLSGLEERFVFVERGGKAERVLVRTGTRTDTHIQIVEGLSPGDIVLTSGVQQLRAGLPVSVELAKL